MGGMLLIVAVDVPFQLWEHNKKLKMTKEEVRQESKETEGDPQVKARIRSMQREMARRRMMAEIPTADVVVTNPTHYSVALKYGDKGMSAPVVVAKGSHLLALRIREIAEENHVPIPKRRRWRARCTSIPIWANPFRKRCTPLSPKCWPTFTSCIATKTRRGAPAGAEAFAGAG
jgi:type III secretory pathway component EscU